MLPYLLAFAGALCYGVGSILQSAAAREVEPTDRLDTRGLVTVTTRLPYLLGLGLDLVGWLLSLFALQHLPLFAVQAVLATSIGITVILAAVILGVRPTGAQYGAIGAMFVGLFCLAAAAGTDTPNEVGTGFVVAVWGAVLVVAALGFAAPRVARGDRAASVLGVVSGLGYGGTAVCARALESDSGVADLLKDPLTWAIIPFGILGIAYYAAALERGSVGVATASQYGAETIVPAVVGVAFLGDQARNGLVWLAALGFGITVASAVALTIVSPPEEAGG